MEHVSALNRITTFTVIYIQFILQIKSQWTDIWFDDLESNNGWTASEYTYFNHYNADGCFTGNCALLWAGGDVDVWMYKRTNIESYSQVQLRYDLTAYDMESGDTCKIYYAYDLKSTKTLIKTIDPPSETHDTYYRYDDQYVTFPSAVGKSRIWIWLEADGDSSNDDLCYWDNLYLQGVLETTTPTANPPHIPSPSPSNQPTKDPTSSPTIVPTDSPTNTPTNTPTKTPTNTPTNTPTDSPSTTTEANAKVKEESGDDDQEQAEDYDDNENATEQRHSDYIWRFMGDNLYLLLIILFGGIGCKCGCVIYKIMKTKHHQEESLAEVATKDIEMAVEAFNTDAGASIANSPQIVYSFAELEPQAHYLPSLPDSPDIPHGFTLQSSIVEDAVYIQKDIVEDDSGSDMYNQENIQKTPMGVLGDVDSRIRECVDCGEVKEGNVFDEDGEFYCNGCWRNCVEQYCNDLVMSLLETV